MADTTLPPIVDDLRCAPQAVELGLDPRGTATRCSTLVLIEYPGLWPARIEDIDLIAGLPPLDPGHRILTTRGEDSEAMPALTVWRAGDDLRFRGVDYEVEPGRMAEAIDALAEGDDPAAADGVMTVGPAPVEVLICGHGRRDTCCGNFGIRLLAQAQERAAEAWPGVRLRRCSHTGGHRFAPTAVTLPEGRMWAFLDLDLLDAAVTGRREPALADSNRGLMALDPLAQVAEATVWDATGGDWRATGNRVTVTAEGPPADDGSAAFVVTWTGAEAGDTTSDITAGSARVEVERTGAVPVPDCGAPLEQARKTSPVFAVRSIA